MTDLLADAKAELYQGDPEGFMARRGELVAQAREAGEAAAAQQIGAPRKPTRSAWVVNRLVRADPEVTGRLAALAAELHQAGLDGGQIRELTAARARLVDALTPQALDDLPAAPRALVRAAHWAGFGLAGNTQGASAPGPPAAKTKKPEPTEPSAERERRHR